MTENFEKYFTDTVSIYAITKVRDTVGQPINGYGEAVYEDIACKIRPLSGVMTAGGLSDTTNKLAQRLYCVPMELSKEEQYFVEFNLEMYRVMGFSDVMFFGRLMQIDLEQVIK